MQRPSRAPVPSQQVEAERHHRRELWLLQAEDLFDDVKLIDELADPAATETGAGEGGGDDALDDYELCDVDDTCAHAIPWEHRKLAVDENEESKSSTAAHKNRRPHKRKRRKAREPKRIFNEYRAIANRCPRCRSPFANLEMRQVQARVKAKLAEERKGKRRRVEE
ncbi:uncharacterized protein ACA1_089280 [Acanthamoeba castellanii str. Neff]|uniref:Uncharacterized protein n=1 Tax=Acanthamoeba castellanii (strain ATCC 30010 / Neff) TaxID=1257118 RepID=L8GUL0_ACACF|nr:uncharacterized protein ACA1_089280 [Acanthamoeba castellanii str. Neff]ELR16680.1 hypothetical protein ACA1_089280 [Acanthamoeba castellanii str. Neff]